MGGREHGVQCQSPDGRRTLCEGGSYPRSFWPRRSRIRTCEDKVEAVPAWYKGVPMSDSAENLLPKCEDVECRHG